MIKIRRAAFEKEAEARHMPEISISRFGDFHSYLC